MLQFRPCRFRSEFGTDGTPLWLKHRRIDWCYRQSRFAGSARMEKLDERFRVQFEFTNRYSDLLTREDTTAPVVYLLRLGVGRRCPASISAKEIPQVLYARLAGLSVKG